MARLVRADLVDPHEVAVFHCLNRCVRTGGTVSLSVWHWLCQWMLAVFGLHPMLVSNGSRR